MIKDYVPHFTEEELYDYYYSEHDFWDRFCEKINFPGDETVEMHQSLLDAMNDP